MLTGAADPWTVLTSADTSGEAISACVAICIWGAVYGIAARRPSPRGRRWPSARTAWFLAGVALLAYAYGSGLQLYEDDPAVHVTQHMLVMMAVAPLLTLGAPLTLLLRSLPIRARRLVVRELRGSSLRVFGGRFAAVLLAIDYYLTMYVYELTPLRSFAERHGLVHAAVHLYFLLCGILFWLPVAGVDPVRFRPSPRVRAAMVAIGLPAFGSLGAIELVRGQAATGWAYVVSGAALTVLGLALLAATERGRSDARLRRTSSWAREALRGRMTLDV